MVCGASTRSLTGTAREQARVQGVWAAAHAAQGSAFGGNDARRKQMRTRGSVQLPCMALDAEVRASVLRGSPRCALLLGAAVTAAIFLVAALVSRALHTHARRACRHGAAGSEYSAAHTPRRPRPLSCAALELAHEYAFG